ncbi:MAG: putative short-chain dehydrogenase/reductase [Betaproteobacteria bacterium]|nr:SDR family NAD(P)-dependent oxidoreductase [Rhodocyclaceae bacterium]
MSGTMLADKVAVITGAGRGIGRAMALAMAAQGAKVVVNDIGASIEGEGGDVGPAQQVVDEIRAVGGAAAASTDSVATWASAQRIVQCALDQFGRIDCVVNNAGILRDRMFHKMEPEDWQAVVDVHLNGAFYVSRSAAPHFRKQNGGAYVHITSGAGLIGNIGQANYAAAKIGLAGLSRSIALDMAPFNVRSNLLSPRAWSRMVGSIPADTPERVAFLDKLKKSLDPAQIAPMAVFLASDAAKDVSGQIFTVIGNEVFLMSQIRPLRSIHRDSGWTPESLAERVLPAFKTWLTPMERTMDVFCWDPI